MNLAEAIEGTAHELLGRHARKHVDGDGWDSMGLLLNTYLVGLVPF